MESFADWLLEELRVRDLTQSELAREAGLGSGTISNIMVGNRKIGQETLIKIAHAFNLPPEIVFRKAGVFPPKPETDEMIEQIMFEATQLTQEEKKELLAFIEMKRNLRKK